MGYFIVDKQFKFYAQFRVEHEKSFITSGQGPEDNDRTIEERKLSETRALKPPTDDRGLPKTGAVVQNVSECGTGQERVRKRYQRGNFKLAEERQH